MLRLKNVGLFVGRVLWDSEPRVALLVLLDAFK